MCKILCADSIIIIIIIHEIEQYFYQILFMMVKFVHCKTVRFMALLNLYFYDLHHIIAWK